MDAAIAEITKPTSTNGKARRRPLFVLCKPRTQNLVFRPNLLRKGAKRQRRKGRKVNVLGGFAPLRLCVKLLWLRLKPRAVSVANSILTIPSRPAQSPETALALC